MFVLYIIMIKFNFIIYILHFHTILNIYILFPSRNPVFLYNSVLG